MNRCFNLGVFLLFSSPDRRQGNPTKPTQGAGLFEEQLQVQECFDSENHALAKGTPSLEDNLLFENK